MLPVYRTLERVFDGDTTVLIEGESGTGKDALAHSLHHHSTRSHAPFIKIDLGSFPDAVAFVTRLAFDAEAADHHPDIHINYKRVTLTFSTHSEGGLTEKDFDGARAVDAIAS